MTSASTLASTTSATDTSEPSGKWRGGAVYENIEEGIPDHKADGGKLQTRGLPLPSRIPGTTTLLVVEDSVHIKRSRTFIGM